VIALVMGCSGAAKRSRPISAPPPTVAPGTCANPDRDGSVSAKPDIKRANRDLDRDGIDEVVVADRALCNGRNCHWNLFRVVTSKEATPCHEYLGTVSGATIEVAAVREAGFPELRSWWTFSDERALLSVYHFREVGYRLIETLMCHQEGGDGVRCVSEEPR